MKDYKQLIIIREDLNMSPGKLAAMASHCSNAFFVQFIQNNICHNEKNELLDNNGYYVDGKLDKETYDLWINGIFRKIICKAKNKDKLLKVVEKAKELGLKENEDFWLVKDYCFTEIKPEEFDEIGQGRTLVGIGFKPLPEDIEKELSKNYRLM